jgi:hypothetical protein
MGFNGVVLKAFASPCLFPWACHARLFYFSKLQGVSLWYSCSDSLDSFLDKALISQRCPILKGLFFTARKLWLALLFRKTCRCLFFGFFVEPWDYPSSAQQYFVCNFWCIFSKPNSFQMSPCLLDFDFWGTLRFDDGSRSFPKIVFWNPAGKRDVVRPCSS